MYVRNTYALFGRLSNVRASTVSKAAVTTTIRLRFYGRSTTGDLRAHGTNVPTAPPMRLPIPNPNPNPFLTLTRTLY